MSRTYNQKKSSKAKGRGKSKDEEDEFGAAKVDNKGRRNDPNDYVTSPEIAKQASNLSFQNVIGSGTIIDTVEVPSIAVFFVNPSLGVTETVSHGGIRSSSDRDASLTPNAKASMSQVDGVNMMSAKIYTLLSSFSGRTSNYTPGDVSLMIGAIASILELSEHMRRVMGLALTYNQRNRTMPLQLIRSLGYDPDDIISHLADYRMQFNIQMSRINQIPMLDNIGFLRKSRQIFQRVFYDDNSPMAQMYVMVPASVWELDETSFPTGSYLKTVSLTAGYGTKTLATDLALLSRLITNMLNATTLNLVYADLLNLATKMRVPTFQMDYLAENYVVMPEYNRTFLLQIHNASILKNPSTANQPSSTGYDTWYWTDPNGNNMNLHVTNENDVYSDPNTGGVIYQPSFLTNATWRPGTIHDHVVDMDTPLPSPGDIIDALRYSIEYSGYVARTGDASTDPSYHISVPLPDHYIVGARVYKNGPNAAVSVNESMGVVYGNSAYTTFDKFTKFPLIYDIGSGSDVAFISGDLNFYTTVNYDYLNRINKLFYEGLFDFRVSGYGGKEPASNVRK